MVQNSLYPVVEANEVNEEAYIKDNPSLHAKMIKTSSGMAAMTIKD